MADHGNITTPDAGGLDTAAKKYAAGKGWAMDDGSYTIRPADNHGKQDLQKAIKAVGRGGSSHNAIRKHIIARAKTLGLSDMIPDNWNSDGSMRGLSMETERRFTTGVIEVRAAGDETPARIGGYAAKFNTYSRNLGGFVEQVAPTFFNKSRGDGWPDVICRFNHDDSMLLGTTAAGTLALDVDDTGLAYDVTPPTSMRNVVEWVQRGDVRKSSFAFRTLEDEWATTPEGGPLRTLHTGSLVDTAPVTMPAYPDTSSGLRSLAWHMDADLDEVRSLADAGELRRFFTRTDVGAGVAVTPSTTHYGPGLMARIRVLREPGA
ncbi:MAG: HK97 family phage prohead protease [Nocardioidaceae bacterium]